MRMKSWNDWTSSSAAVRSRYRVLSAGQQRRVALARILLSVPQVCGCWMSRSPILTGTAAELVTELIAGTSGRVVASLSSPPIRMLTVSAPVKRLNAVVSENAPSYVAPRIVAGPWQPCRTPRSFCSPGNGPGDVLNPLFFFAMVSTLFPLAIGPGPEQLQTDWSRGWSGWRPCYRRCCRSIHYF